MSKIVPNSYSTPFYFVDVVMRYLSGNEYKCLNVVARKTFGWDKATDRISKSQIETLTGMSEETVENCMSELVKYRLVVRVSENNNNNHGVEWSVQKNDRSVDLDGLHKRRVEQKASNRKKVSRALSNRGVGMLDIPRVGMLDIPRVGMSNIPHNINYQQEKSSSSSAKREKIISFYEQEVQQKVTPTLEEKILKAKDTYGEVLVHEAIEEAVSASPRPNWNYIEAILKRWSSEGKAKTKGSSNNANRNYGNSNSKRTGNQPPQSSTGEATRAAAQRIMERKKLNAGQKRL